MEAAMATCLEGDRRPRRWVDPNEGLGVGSGIRVTLRQLAVSVGELSYKQIPCEENVHSVIEEIEKDLPLPDDQMAVHSVIEEIEKDLPLPDDQMACITDSSMMRLIRCTDVLVANTRFSRLCRCVFPL
eukprot:GHVH01009242.1.p2 GENE.GHVH01009242.1~~GHVH01009242.1.p2  ORF type:complete len:129 (-),score=23.64 GHVH01009242.1:836-1222(-)